MNEGPAWKDLGKTALMQKVGSRRGESSLFSHKRIPPWEEEQPVIQRYCTRVVQPLVVAKGRDGDNEQAQRFTVLCY